MNYLFQKYSYLGEWDSFMNEVCGQLFGIRDGTSLRQFGYWKRKGNREWTRAPDEKWATEQYEIGEMN